MREAMHKARGEMETGRKTILHCSRTEAAVDVDGGIVVTATARQT